MHATFPKKPRDDWDFIEVLQDSPSSADEDVKVDDSAMRTSSAAPAPRTALSKGELALAGYLLARTVDGRVVTPEQIERHQRASETVEQVRDTLQWGRCNVTRDLQETDHANFRVNAAWRAHFRANQLEGRSTSRAVQAAASVAAKTGMCTEYALASHYLHLDRLKAGESIAIVGAGNKADSHLWAVLTHGDSGHRLVLDAWGEGPPIDAADAKFMKPSTPRSILMETDHEKAGEEKAAFEAGLNEHVPHRQDEVERRRSQYERVGNRMPRKFQREPLPIIRKSFAKRARAEIDSVAMPRGGKLSPREVKIREVALGIVGKVSGAARRHLGELQSAKNATREANVALAVTTAKALGADDALARSMAGDIIERARDLRRVGPSRVKPEFRVPDRRKA